MGWIIFTVVAALAAAWLLGWLPGGDRMDRH